MLPDLAAGLPTTENGGVSTDGAVHTFHLKRGIRFAPPVGREVTSADFTYGFGRMAADAPSVPLYQPKVSSMHTADVGNFFLHPVWVFDYPACYFTTARQ